MNGFYSIIVIFGIFKLFQDVFLDNVA